MEKNAVLAVIRESSKAFNEKEFYINRYSLDLNIGRARRSNAMNLRPWGALTEIATIDLAADKFNYLVNGAFEYSGYSWEVKGDAKADYVTTTNCDADNNYMVTSHALQGISLQLDVAPGAKAEVVQLRPIGAKAAMEARFRMFVKSSAGCPLDNIKVFLGEKQLEMVVVKDDSRANGEWYELRSKALEMAPGTYRFRMEVSNPDGSKNAVFNFDELRLRLKSINRITK